MTMKLLRLFALSGLALLGACAAPANRSTLGAGHLTTAMLLEASPLTPASGLPDVARGDILSVTPEMSAFLDHYVDPEHNEHSRLKRLLYAVIGEGKFELLYDDRTRTAEETFRDQRGNCLSFTNMFVAMARQVGLDARYQEVETPADWSLTGQSFLLSQHVNVYLEVGQEEARVVDFNIVDFDSGYRGRVISDTRARAHYFNNIGAEHMLAGSTPLALANFLASVREDPAFAPAWTNLGILHRREGYPGYAEVAYLQALQIDRSNLVAMSNLANLYEQEGLLQQATEYRSQVQSHRNNNPYYRFYAATEDFINGDYRSAIGHLKYAIRKRDDEPRFYSLLSFSYLMSGDRSAAEHWMKKAEALSSETADREKYHHKLNWLMNQRTD